ncbi:MAG: hypothetical protein CMJ86_06730 [Planctomycetes bacterium]|nr:hypothetical protein [Planctomycetota bacterium]
MLVFLLNQGRSQAMYFAAHFSKALELGQTCFSDLFGVGVVRDSDRDLQTKLLGKVPDRDVEK